MISRTTKILFLALLLVYSSKAVTGHWISLPTSMSGTAYFSPDSTSLSNDKYMFSLPGFTLEQESIDGKPYSRPLLNGGFPLLKEGCPDLPGLSATFQLPATGDYRLSVISARYVDYPDYSIIPSAGDVSRNETNRTIKFGEVYQKDEFFPSEVIETSEPYIIRNIRNQSFLVSPFQYNPVSKVLRVYYEMQLQLVRTDKAGINELNGFNTHVNTLQDLYHPSLNSVVKPSLKSGSLPSAGGSMLIICPKEFQPAMEAFIQWKKECGIEVEIVDAEQFSDAGEIKQFVSNYYNNSGSLSYLLLVGDAEQVPSFMYAYGASDNYYSYLCGNDHYPDILVGRFSASNISQVEVQVKRTLEYEKNPGLEAGWYGKASGIASTLSPGDDGESDYQHVRNLLSRLKEFTYSSVNEYFDGSQGGIDVEGDPTAQSVLDGFNAGTGLILYTGHGATNTWASGHITSSALSFLNNAGKYPFIWSTACETGNFTASGCLAESWLQAADNNGNPLGAVAALMASGLQTTYPPMEGQDEMVNQLVNAGEDNMRTFGGLSVSGMYKMNDVYSSQGYAITDTWILFGDPSLQVRTSTPAKLLVNHNDWIGRGRSEFSISANISSGRACLTSDGQIIGSALIVDGQATIILTLPVEADKMLLTVTAFNRIPYQAEIKVIDAPAASMEGYPVNHSKRIPIHTRLQWDSGSAAIPDHYRLYLGTDNPPTNVLNGIELKDLSYIPELQLQYLTKYYWRIDALKGSSVAEGNVWDFETIYGPDEDFETSVKDNTMWVSGGTTGWSYNDQVVFRGKKSYQSGIVSKGDYSSLIYPCEVSNCDFVGFWFRTQGENEDKLQLLIDNKLTDEWSGQNEWEYVSYDVETGSHTIEWRFINNSNNGNNAAWLDDISLPIHEKMMMQAGDGGMICEGSGFTPSALVNNYNSVKWTSSGDGTFDGFNLVQPVYTPGAGDILNGTVQLTLNVNSFEGCSLSSSSLMLQTSRSPQVNLPDDTIALKKAPLYLDASSAGASSWLWLPVNETGPAILVDTTGIEQGTKTLTLQVTGSNGCLTQKDITIHYPGDEMLVDFSVYPNPCDGHFSIEPQNGVLVVEHLSLYNSKGELVWQQKGDLGIDQKKDFTIQSLPSATYYLVAGSGTDQRMKPLIIR